MNAHYLYALARAGRRDAVEAGLASVRARSAADDEEARRVWAPVAPIVEAARWRRARRIARDDVAHDAQTSHT
jgi:hypothetical protein